MKNINSKLWIALFVLFVILLQFFFYFSGRDATNRPIFIDDSNFEQGVHLAQDDCVHEDNAAIQDLKERIVRLEMEKKELVLENRELQSNCEEDTSKVWKKQLGHEKIAFVGYPSSGSFAIQKLISRISNLSTFSVYPSQNLITADESMGANLDIYSECYSSECSLPEGAPLLIQTYFPTVTLQSKLPTIEKIIRIVRNPADNIYSLFNTAKESKFFASRIRGWNSHVDYEINELKKFSDFWDRFTREVFTSTLVVRYEDFCVRPDDVVIEIYRFLQLDFDKNELRKLVSEYQCDPKEHIGNSFSQFTKEQFTKVSSRLSDYIDKYDYSLLFRDV